MLIRKPLHQVGMFLRGTGPLVPNGQALIVVQ
jgi:hypothetical protein